MPIIDRKPPILPGMSDKPVTSQKATSFGTQILGNPHHTHKKPSFLSAEKATIPPSTNAQNYLHHFQMGKSFNQGQVMKRLNDGNRKITPAAKDTANPLSLHNSKSAARGACMVFSASWLSMMFADSSEAAPERLQRLSAMDGSQQAMLQKVYRDYGEGDANDDSAFHESVNALKAEQKQIRPEIDAKQLQIDNARTPVNQHVDASNGMIKKLDILVSGYNAHIKIFNEASAGQQKSLSPILEKKNRKFNRQKSSWRQNRIFMNMP